MNETPRFHITITDHEEKRTLVDIDTDCIIGAIDETEDKTRCLCYTSCNSVTLAHAIDGAQTVIAKILQEDPRLSLLLMLLKQAEEATDDEKTED